MLVLSRKKDEQIILEHKETKERITITMCSADRCRLGVEAAQHWRILRDEHDRANDAKKAAQL